MASSTLVGTLLFVILCGVKPYHIWSQEKNCYCSVTGTVTDEDSNQVPSEVIVFKLDIQDGHARPSPACSAKTDPEGHFTCLLRSKGQYIVEAHTYSQLLAAGNHHDNNIEEVYPITFYPNAMNIDSAVRIVLNNFERGSANITLASVQSQTIHVTLPATPPRSSLTVSLHGSDYDIPTGINAEYEPSTGTFAIRSVPPGIYRIDVGWYADEMDHRGTGIVTTGPGAAATVNIQESTNVRIYGVVGEDTWYQSRPPILLVLKSIDNSFQKDLTSAITPDRQFAFPVVPDGRYRLLIQGTNNSFVETVSANGRQLPDRRISLVAGESYGPLSVEINNQAASAEGTVEDVAQTAGKTSVIVQSVDDGEVKAVLTDQQQHFLATGLRPGEYRLYAWSSLEDVEYRNPDYLARFASRSTTVVLDEAEHATQLEVQMLPKPY